MCMIGDDDGVTPEIMEAACWARSEGLDSLAVRIKVNYLWPATGVPSTLFTKVTGGHLAVRGLYWTAKVEDILRKVSKCKPMLKTVY